MRKYLPRIADDLLDRSLKASGAVLIEGPKWCGKTSTAFHKAKTAIYMQDPDQRANYLQIASIKPSILLQGDHQDSLMSGNLLQFYGTLFDMKSI